MSWVIVGHSELGKFDDEGTALAVAWEHTLPGHRRPGVVWETPSIFPQHVVPNAFHSQVEEKTWAATADAISVTQRLTEKVKAVPGVDPRTVQSFIVRDAMNPGRVSIQVTGIKIEEFRGHASP